MNNSIKKKILIVVTPLTGMGGIIRRLKLWIRFLHPRYDIKILCHCSNPDTVEILEKEGCAVRHSKRLCRMGRISILPGLVDIYNEIKAYSPAAVISMFLWSDFLTSASIFFQRILNRRRTPHIVHLAGDPVPIFQKSLSLKLYKLVVEAELRTPSKVICICRHDAELFTSKYNINREKIVMVPIGIELHHFKEKRQLHTPLAFGVVSRLSPVKNIVAIIRTFKLIREESGRHFRLEIFGDGPDREKLQALTISMGLEDIVRFHGWVKEPLYAFDSVDCLLMFSHTEGTPRSILEAAIRGVPTIAKKVGGVGEMIVDGTTGYLVQTESDLKKQILSVLRTDKKLLKSGAVASRFVADRYSIEREIGDIVNIIETLT